MKRPIEADYASQVAYTRALEAYCDSLAQPEQEPVGRFAKFTDGIWREVTNGSAGQPLYTAPSKREWVGLTERELVDLWFKESLDWLEFARVHEAKLKEKNFD